MAMAERNPILISGGGIGGLAAALALARVGYRTVVAERRRQWSEAGAGIQLSPNGVAVLDQLGVAAVLAPQAGRPQEIVVRDAPSSRVLQRLPLGDWISGRHGMPYWLAHRRDLQAALLTRVESEPLIAIAMGFETAFYAVDGATVRLVAVDGRSLEGAALIGADGVFSRVRQQLLAPRAPRRSGLVAARMVIPTSAIRSPSGAPPDAVGWDTTGVWLAPGAHIVHYPVRAGRETAFVVIRPGEGSDLGWSAPVPTGEMEHVLQAIAPALAACLDAPHAWQQWSLFELEPLDRLSGGPVALLGDAAHPTLPFLAQGGALALEDAWVLARSVAEAGGTAAISEALATYSRRREARSRRVVAASRRNGRIFHLAGAAALARNGVMRLIPGERVVRGFDWVYGWKPG